MKNKKGFTLVELLAVIVILAVLILLALPQVLAIMENAKKNSFKTEAASIIRAAEAAYASEDVPKDCYLYKETSNELDGYMNPKSGYSAAVKRDATSGEWSIDLTSDSYWVDNLSKDTYDSDTVMTKDDTKPTSFSTTTCTPTP